MDMTKHPKRPRDPNQLAKLMVDLATGEADDVREGQDKNEARVRAGRLGGKKGGLVRAKRLSPERRREIAKKAARTRWKTDADAE